MMIPELTVSEFTADLGLNLDGVDLILKIREKNLQIPAILMTSYDSPTHHSQRIISDEKTSLLNKPVPTERLGSVIADLLS